MRRTLHNTPRPGFTLVELLVVAALIVVIMTVMATAFQAVLGAFSNLNSAANLADQLRAAQDIIKRDLNEQHLENEEGRPQSVASLTTAWNTPGKKGFFKMQGVTPATEGTEDGMPSFRADGTANHILHFTCKRSGERPEDTFSALGLADMSATPAPAVVPSLRSLNTTNNPNLFVSRWAEVAYFLVPTGTTTTDTMNTTPAPLPLHALYRRERVLSDHESSITVNLTNSTFYPGISWRTSGANAVVNSPADLTNSVNRLSAYVPIPAVASLPATIPDPRGSDLLLANVISFQVLPLTAPMPPSPAPPPPLTNLNYASSPGGVLDTAAGGTRMIGLEIKLRIYDTKTFITRQVTIRHRF